MGNIFKLFPIQPLDTPITLDAHPEMATEKFLNEDSITESQTK